MVGRAARAGSDAGADSGKVLVMSGLPGGTENVVLAAFRRADAVPTTLDEVDDPAALKG